jgi:hypothetical protein
LGSIPVAFIDDVQEMPGCRQTGERAPLASGGCRSALEMEKNAAPPLRVRQLS